MLASFSLDTPNGERNTFKQRLYEAWCSRSPPFKTDYRCWAREGSEGAAARAVVKYAWIHFPEGEGLSQSDCPVAGLF